MTIESIVLSCMNITCNSMLHVCEDGSEVFTGDFEHLLTDGYGERTVWAFTIHPNGDATFKLTID